MNKIIKWSVIIFVLANLFLSAWSVLNNDIYYYTDIARDFMIFSEIAEKKLVLIGPRADFQGLFHGIAWYYINMPAFLLGGGNPVTVGWFWVILTAAFLLESYLVTKSLFGIKSGVIALLLLSVYIVPYAQGYFHGNGAMLIFPIFFYLFVRYLQTAKLKYLIGHFITLGFLIHFEIAVGIPFMILSSIALIYLIFRNKKFRHIFSLAIPLIFFLPFLLFDLRHDFLQIKSILSYAIGKRDAEGIPFIASLDDRLSNIGTTVLNFFRFSLSKLNLFVFALFIYSSASILKSKDKYKNIYLAFLYFFIGFYTLSLLHGGLLIMFWWLPVSVLPIIIFSSLHRYAPKKAYYLLLVAILSAGIIQNISFVKSISITTARSTTSWRFHFDTAKRVFDDAPKEFGYFLYSPDAFGYQDKYAMSYTEKLYDKKAFRFEKKPVTYVIIEPPPPDKVSILSPTWWMENKMLVTKKPVKSIDLNLYYKINKYIFSDAEQKIPSAVTTADWLYFR